MVSLDPRGLQWIPILTSLNSGKKDHIWISIDRNFRQFIEKHVNIQVILHVYPVMLTSKVLSVFLVSEPTFWYCISYGIEKFQTILSTNQGHANPL